MPRATAPVSATVLANRLMARARFRHLQALVRLCELGSLQRTAAAMGITQPAVTHLLADLESLLEVTLFQRHARGVRPTPACEDLLPIAQQLLQGLQAGAEAVAARHSGGAGLVRLGASSAAVLGLLVTSLPAFQRRHPAIQVQLREAEIDGLLAGVSRGEVDMVACRQPAVVPQGWGFTPLVEDEFIVICAPDHPLTRKRKLQWADLARQTWLPAPSGSLARSRYDALVEARFETPPPSAQVITRNPALTTALLRDQPALALVPAGSVRPQLDAGQIVSLHLPERLPFDPIGVLLPQQGAGRATQALSDFLQGLHAPD